MKTKAKPAPAKEEDCPPAIGVTHTARPAPAHSGPGPDAPGGAKTEFVYYGQADTVLGFNSGTMVQHNLSSPGDSRSSFFTLRGGPHEKRTLSKLKVQALHQTCVVTINGGPPATLSVGSPPLDIPAGATFTLATAGVTAVLVTSLSGPGLGDPSKEREER
jgi:hypothetical protein